MDLDSLNLQISADTSKANKALDNLIDKLDALSQHLNIKGIDGFTRAISDLSTALNGVNGENLAKASDSLAKLSKASTNLTKLGGEAKGASAAVSNLAKEIADGFNISDKTVVNELTKAITNLYRATDSNSLLTASKNVNDLLHQYARFQREAVGANKAAMDFLKTTSIHLDSTWAKELGDDAKSIRGTIGMMKTTRQGGLEAIQVVEELKRLGASMPDVVNNDDALRAIAEFINQQKQLTEANLTASQAMREGLVPYNVFDTALEQIASRIGMTAEQFTNMAMEADSPATQRGFQQLGILSENLLKIGNPFEEITAGLQELGNVKISDTMSYLYVLSDNLSKLGSKTTQHAAMSLNGIAQGLDKLSMANIPKFGTELYELAFSLRALGSKNIVNASTALEGVARGLNALKGVGSVPQIAGLTELGKSLNVFGYKSATQAIQNIPLLAEAFNKLLHTLSKAPVISQNVIDMANAMANLSANTKGVAPAAQKASRGLDIFNHTAKKTTRTSFSLAAALGKIYATYWAVFRVFRMFGNSIKLASDLTEVQNVVDQTFGQMTGKMEEFSKSAVENLGMSELTAKKIGSQFQAMGKNMAISNEQIKATNDFVQATTHGYADVSESMADVSINLTRLAGDMASFYNLPYEDVAQDLQSIFTGQTRPLRQYGLDLTEATLKEWALRNGMDADIKSMTQAQKTLLRYQYVMANTTAAHGDFIRTQDTWANTIKRAQENLKRLQIILGQIGVNTFKPLVASFNGAMNDILHLAESTLNSLGKIFGWQVEISDVGILDDYADGLEDVEDGYDGAGKSAKKFKNMLLGIDELNLLPDNSDKDKGSGAGSAMEATAAGIEDSLVNMKKTEQGYESIYDTLFKLGARIGEVQKDWLKGLDWDAIYGKAESFGKNFASFLNGYFSDAETFYQKGRFIANALNTVAHAIYGFFHEFDGYQFGKDIGFELNGFTQNLDWGTIQGATYEMAHDLTESINGIIENVDWQDVGRTIAEMLNTVQLFISTFWNEIKWDQLGVSAGELINSFFLNWDEEEAARLIKGKLQAVFDFLNNLLSTADFEMIGEKIGHFLSELNLADYADDIAKLIWNLIKASFDLLVNMSEEAPIETALILAFGWMKFKGFGSVFGNSMASSISKNFAPALSTILKTDLGTLAAGSGILGKAALIGAGIGGAILAGFVGYNVGREIGKYLFPEDEMWYDEAKDFGKTVATIIEAGMEGELKPALALMLSDMGIRVGETRIGDGQHSGGGARDDGSGSYTHRLSVKDAQGKSQEAMEAAAELRRAAQEAEEKANLLMQSPISRYNSVVNNTVSSSQKMQQAINGGRESMERMEQEAKEAAQSTNVLYKILNTGASSLPSGGGNVKLVAESMKHLNTQSLVAKAGIEQLNASIDNVSKQKDKTKNSVAEIEGNMKNISGMIGNTMSVAFQTIDTAKQNLVNSMNNMFSADMWSNVLSAVPKAFRQMWTDSINVMKQMWSEMARWINTNAKLDIPKVKVGNGEVGGGQIQVRVPKFETGGAIPNDGSLFVANERGAEVVANMGRSTGVMNTDQMEAAVANGMMRAFASGSQNIQVVLNGDAADFFTAMVKQNNNSIMRTGASPLRV